MSPNTSRPTRRSLLAWSGATAALTAGGVVLGTGSAAAEAFPADGSALLVPSARVNLADGSENYIREKALQNDTVLQSIGFDNENGRVYVAQVMQGGLKLTGESAAVSKADRDLHGDLTVTQWDLAGNKTGYMYLRGFGHGVSMGVEPAGSGAYLWTEVDAQPTSDGSSRGMRLARFKFSNGAVLDNTSSTLVKHTPMPGSTNNNASVDPVYGRLVHRCSIDGKVRIRVHDLDLARLGVWNKPIADIVLPDIDIDIATYGTPSFQGYAVVGRYLYMLHGNAYGSTQVIDGTTVVISKPDIGNTHVTSVDLTTGNIIETKLTKAAYTLTFREPEGLGIQIPDPAQPGVFRLGIGFASGESGGRLASIYYKDLLVQP